MSCYVDELFEFENMGVYSDIEVKTISDMLKAEWTIGYDDGSHHKTQIDFFTKLSASDLRANIEDITNKDEIAELANQEADGYDIILWLQEEETGSVGIIGFWG